MSTEEKLKALQEAQQAYFKAHRELEIALAEKFHAVRMSYLIDFADETVQSIEHKLTNGGFKLCQ